MFVHGHVLWRHGFREGTTVVQTDRMTLALGGTAIALDVDLVNLLAVALQQLRPAQLKGRRHRLVLKVEALVLVVDLVLEIEKGRSERDAGSIMQGHTEKDMRLVEQGANKKHNPQSC